MYARKRLDIGWLDLAAGLMACLVARERRRTAQRIEAWFSARGDALCCLSVRSGLDLYLEELALPRGSEVLMSALTIPDMWRIVERHGLIPVPVDVDPATLAPRPERVREHASDKTRMLILAHLFGTRMRLEPYLPVVREKSLLLVEDCAQAFTGDDFKGDPAADVSLFSFGPIKTATALAGGVLCMRDRDLLERMRRRQARYALQSKSAFARRIFKYSALKVLTLPWLYACFVRACALTGTDHDRVIQGTVRGFKGGDFFAKIRLQPSAALLALLERRLEAFDGARILRRTALAQQVGAALSDSIEVPGDRAGFNSHWIFAILADDRERIVANLRQAGFDATTAASLSAVAAPEGRAELEPREAQAIVERIIYLPIYPELPEHAASELALLLRANLRPRAAANLRLQSA